MPRFLPRITATIVSFAMLSLPAASGAHAIGSMHTASPSLLLALAPMSVKAAATSIASIDPKDQDFRDLDFLVNVIGDARVVQLGEASHGGGNGFSAKARLVEFLHQRMGFDVLVWEEGIYDMRLAEAGIRSTKDPMSVAREVMRPAWSKTEEVRPLFQYAKASQATAHPLEMAGYDGRFSATGFAAFATDLTSFVATAGDIQLRTAATKAVQDLLGAYTRICCTTKTSDQRDLVNLQQASDRLLALIDTHRVSFDRTHGGYTTSFMEQAVASLRSAGTGKFYQSLQARAPSGSPAAGFYFGKFWDQRDQQGALNLRWLIEKGYPGHKVIFWTHNAHAMKAFGSLMFNDIHASHHPGDMSPVGIYLSKWLGNRLYTIAMTHFDGAEQVPGKLLEQIPVAGEGSLEAKLHALKKPYLFLNLHDLERDTSRLSPSLTIRVLTPQSANIPVPPANTITNISRVFDGIFYIDRLTPATLAPVSAETDSLVH